MTVDPARVAQAWKLLAELGVTLADLQRSVQPARPTVDAYLPQVLAAAGPGALRAYRSYWQRMATTWAGIPIDAVTASDIQALRQQVTDRARVRRNSRSGRHAGELLVAAARAFYNQAIADGLIEAADSPAHRVAKPRRLPSTRRALTPVELTYINQVARTTGNDTILDALLLRLHTEPPADAAAPSDCGCRTSTPNAACCSCGRKAARSAGSRSPSTSPPASPSTPLPAARSCPPTPCCGTRTAMP